ncbi:GlgB N-terminal domain-containing protein, partial [Microbacterium sp.]|uniref:GlgB N-terminal domain-containing protein n=1 Tax=Microbacterium sp. TaxID=51671 RepID=UPI002E4D72D9|nr:1,4-alpha-glucan branching enzyme [Microbacterium sp.]
MTTTTDNLLDAVAAGSHHDPHSVLGMHLGTDAEGAPEWTIGARRPLAQSVTAVFHDGTRVPLEHVRAGIWEGQKSGDGGSYQLITTY